MEEPNADPDADGEADQQRHEPQRHVEQAVDPAAQRGEGDHGRGMTYTHPTNGKKVRGQKLGPPYDKPSLMKAFAAEKEAAYHARSQDDYEERHRKKDKLERVEEEMHRGWSL